MTSIIALFQSCLRSLHDQLSVSTGRSIAQAVSRWLPTAAARVRSRIWSSGICGGQSGAGVSFLRILRFPFQSSIHQLLHNHPHLSFGAGNIGQTLLQYKGLSPTPLAIKKSWNKKINSIRFSYHISLLNAHIQIFLVTASIKIRRSHKSPLYVR
jgi:hypothetical protein